MYKAYKAGSRAISRLIIPGQRNTHVTQNNKANIHIDVYIDQKNEQNEGTTYYMGRSEEEVLRRSSLLIAATMMGFPVIKLGNGKIVESDPKKWTLFNLHCSLEECEEAFIILLAIARERHIELIQF